MFVWVCCVGGCYSKVVCCLGLVVCVLFVVCCLAWGLCLLRCCVQFVWVSVWWLIVLGVLVVVLVALGYAP